MFLSQKMLNKEICFQCNISSLDTNLNKRDLKELREAFEFDWNNIGVPCKSLNIYIVEDERIYTSRCRYILEHVVLQDKLKRRLK